jgi:hypothetical protein
LEYAVGKPYNITLTFNNVDTMPIEEFKSCVDRLLRTKFVDAKDIDVDTCKTDSGSVKIDIRVDY